MGIKKETLYQLERIANALERIANALEQDQAPKELLLDRPVPEKELPQGVSRGTRNQLTTPRAAELFLRQRGFAIRPITGTRQLEPSSDLVSLAQFMGKNYSLIRSFYLELKTHLSKGTTLVFPFENLSSAAIEATREFGDQLYQAGLLSEMSQNGVPWLSARPSREGRAINFLTGKWLEHFIWDQLRQVVGPAQPIDYLMNRQVILPDGRDFEFDIVAMIDGNPFWFEAKSGNYAPYLPKYADISQILGLNSEQSFLVLAEIGNTFPSEITARCHMTVTSPADFSTTLSQRLAPGA